MEINYLLFLSLYLIGLSVRTSYEVLKKSDRIDRQNKIIFTAVFAAMFLFFAGWFGMCVTDPWRVNLPDIIRWIFVGILIAGFVLAFGALIQLKGVENIQHLVVGGLFKKMRHPMYMGFIFWILGWSVYHGAILSLVIGFIGIGNILYWRSREEREMESRYGDVYHTYQRTTWF
jgi:protein-S-isoprenylcysteine O-methyltransferase Ste14